MTKPQAPHTKAQRLKALHRKALRDLWLMRTQALAIALVVAAGVAMLVMSQATLDSLRATQARMYQDYAFADIWASLTRAPDGVAQQVAALPGIASVQTRVQSAAKLALPGFAEPIEALMESLPDDGSPRLLGRLHLRAGRLPAPHDSHEAVISEAFAKVHGLRPGDRLRATVYGRTQWFTLVGIATSAEYLLEAKPGATFPDNERYAILWVPRQALAAALNMQGAFNQLVVRLSPGAPGEAHRREAEAAAIAAIDRVLARWGGRGALGRMQQISHRTLYEEFQQLGSMTRIFPIIFLGVAAFLLNVVFTRLIGAQRPQVAILKAFGYRTRDVALHYGLMAALVGLLGAALGVAAGAWLGRMLAGLYQENYHFPYLIFRLNGWLAALGAGVALLAAVGGAGRAVLAAARQPVAEAMRPSAPERYRPTLAERLGLARHLSQPARMVLRQIERRPLRALLSIIGLALAGGILMMARFQTSTLTYMVDMENRLADQHDLAVTFIETAPRRALHELAALPGVQQVEGLRTVSVRASNGSLGIYTAIEGLPATGAGLPLRRPLNAQLARMELPPQGLVMSDYLASRLGVGVGGMVQLQVLQGRRRQLQLPVALLINDPVGVRIYMDADALNRALGESNAVSGALLTVQPGQQAQVLRELDRRPRIVAAESRHASVRAFFQLLERITGVFTWVATLMGVVVNFGVVYNSARITLAERARELASLRVLGFTRSEVARILLGELALLVLLSIPLSFAAGWGLTWLLVQGMQNDLFRMPIHIPLGNYAFAAFVTLCSAIASAWAVLRQVRSMDMIEALKTHE